MDTVQSKSVAAGVVTYNPEVDRLLENLRAISPQVDRIIIFDNGSENIGDVRAAARKFKNAELLESARNVGIAAALNVISSTAMNGNKWLITLDQDSISAPDMVASLAQHVDALTPLVTPFILDRNKMTLEDHARLELPPVQYFRRAASKGAITSGALLNLEVLEEIGGFDELFFIDCVDYDLNMRLMRSSYRIARVNTTYLLHEQGKAIKTWLRTPRKSLDGRWYWETFYSFGHTPIRCYYKARNRVLYSKKHWRFIGMSNEGIAQIPQQMLLTLAFEENRIKKLSSFAKGIIDGIRTPAPAHSSLIRRGREYAPFELRGGS
jgi:rhamnosyltransferase